MAYLSHGGTLFDGVLASASVVARLDSGADGNGDALVLTDNGAGRRVVFTLDEGGLASVASTGIYAPTLPETFAVALGSRQVTLGLDDIAAVTAQAEADSQTLYSSRSGQQTDRIEALAVEVGGQTYVYLSSSDGAGIGAYRALPDGTLTPLSFTGDSAQSYAAGITSMATVSMGGQAFLITASATEHGLTSFAIGADGSLQQVDALGAAEYLPVGSPQALEVVELGGAHYVILGSATTSSLTVLEVQSDGRLLPVDQVMDDLGTRFANVTVLESFSHDSRVYVLAAGSDDGLSLFTLLPDGRLIHLETVADTAATSLQNVTDIAVREVGGEVQVFVISGAEAGMTQFTLTPGPSGTIVHGAEADVTGSARNDILGGGSTGVQLSAGQGDDILIDGAGQDALIGGTGADLFVFSADGQRDVVLDFEVGIDRLDLSALGMIHDISAVEITETPTGAILRFGGEEIELVSNAGTTITADMLSTADILNTTRVSVEVPTAPEDPVIKGGGADDHVVGGSTDQVLYGYGGDDILTGGGGADLHRGGDGVDIADYSGAPFGVTVSLTDPPVNTGIAEGDTFEAMEGLSGSAFADRLIGDAGANVLIGGDGRDRLEGWDGDDRIEGGDDDDELLGHAGNDWLEGGGGNDNISASDGDDTVYGGDGHDQLGGGNGNDVLYGGAGNDTIGSGNDDDVIDAGDGNDVTSGGYGADVEYGGAGDDTMAGSYGNDIVYGGPGNDSLGGGTGKDQLYAGDGDDEIGCGSFDDQAWGGNGNDFIGGGEGNDQLYGEAGADKLNGGPGDDAFWGGSEADTYVFNEFISGEIDTIHDFEDGLDVIRLKGVPGGYGGLVIGEVTIAGTTYAEVSFAGHTIRVAGMNADDLGADDFVFI